MHEMGHALGLNDSYLEQDRDSLMYGYLTKGERRLPAKDQAKGATPHAGGDMHFLTSPVVIGTLPSLKSVVVTYTVMINIGTTAPTISNQGTVSGSNFSNVLTDDPTVGGAADPTVTRVEQPPVVANIAPSVNEDAILTFAAANFDAGFSDPNSDAPADILQILRITSLPANGLLKISGATFTVPQDILRANIGTLTYTPNANYNGADSFGWNASDGTLFAASGALVNITVNSVNDVPSFTKGADQTVLEDAGAQTVVGWATNISSGPANESGQAVDFIVTNNNNSLFSAQPAVSATGDLTYTPAADANGTAIVSVSIHDNGGTLNGGVDTSAVQTFNINVTAVNDKPDMNIIDPVPPIPVNSGQQTYPFGGVRSGPANEFSQTLTVTAVSDNTGLIPNPTVTYTSPNTTGSLSFTPVAGQSGTANITVTLMDDGGTLNGGMDTFTQMFPVTVSAPTPTPTPTPTATTTPSATATPTATATATPTASATATAPPTPSVTPTATATATASPTATATPTPTATPSPGLITVSLPIDTFDNSVPIATIIIEPVTTTLIDPTTTAGLNYVGFQGDFTFDSAVVSFVTPGQVQKAGLTGGDWNVSSNILNSGPGTLKTLRISAFSNDFTPLNGSGTLFNLRMLRVSNNAG